MTNDKKVSFVFFGTPEFAVIVLDELAGAGFTPTLVVTAPDKPQGRGLKLTPPPVKMWADEHGVSTLQPEKLDNEFYRTLSATDCELCIVAAYGKIIPKTIIDIPQQGVLNIHPSLLPKYRGASPVEAQILNDDREVGVTVMQIDEKMDHGNILAQKIVSVSRWPLRASELNDILWHIGGKLLVEIIPEWVAGNIIPHSQEHDKATYSKLIKKEDAQINLDGNSYQNFLKIQAYNVWPKAYFFAEKNGKKVRVKIIDADYENDALIIKRVIPEGKREMDYASFLKGNKPISQ
jgi:methionyl-tRNA formyltransferase